MKALAAEARSNHAARQCEVLSSWGEEPTCLTRSFRPGGRRSWGVVWAQVATSIAWGKDEKAGAHPAKPRFDGSILFLGRVLEEGRTSGWPSHVQRVLQSHGTKGSRGLRSIGPRVLFIHQSYRHIISYHMSHISLSMSMVLMVTCRWNTT